MEMVVLLPRRRAARAELTRVSDSASRADVAGVETCQHGEGINGGATSGY